MNLNTLGKKLKDGQTAYSKKLNQKLRWGDLLK